MKKFFAQLRPMERRLAVGVLVILILVLNWLFIWPHFSDWGKLNTRMKNARATLSQYQAAITDTSKYETLVRGYEGQGQPIPQEDQAFNFLRTIRDQAAASGVGVSNWGRQSTKTNEFFNEQSQAISVLANDEQIVDFLYKLGEGASMVRVRDLDLQPDQPHLHLTANIQLVASYQKKPLSAAPAPKANPVATATTSKTSAPAVVKTNSKPATAKSK